MTEEQNITTLHITSNNGSKQLTLKVGDFPEVEEPSDNNNPSNVGDLRKKRLTIYQFNN